MRAAARVVAASLSFHGDPLHYCTHLDTGSVRIRLLCHDEYYRQYCSEAVVRDGFTTLDIRCI